MAWCSRTSRNPTGVSKSVSPAVGPGSYNTNAIGSIHKPKPSYAAFGSTEIKDTHAGMSNHITPGPGSYQILGTAQTVPSFVDTKSSMFKSTSGRTNAIQSALTPGPGAYASAHPSAFQGGKQKKSKALRRSQSAAEKIQPNKVKWVRVPTAPSIPNVAQSFGYEEGPKGQMILQKPVNTGHSGCSNDISGPGEYDPLQSLHRLQGARGANFSKSRTTRDYPASHAAPVPGPGSYQPDPVAAAASTAMKQSAVFQSKLSRDRASQLQSHISKAPGPGSYTNPTGFQPQKKPEHLQFFGSTSSRFEQEKFVSQPTTYNPPPDRRQHLSQPKGRQTPFCSTDKRFDKSSLHANDSYTVGPGSYEASGLVDELHHRVHGRTGVFGSTTKRFEAPKPQSVLETVFEQDRSPLRQTNQVEEAPKLKSSSFASATDRFQSQKKDRVPCPGDYEVSMTWDKPGGKAVFNSHLDRGSYLDKNNLPGPGAYTTSDLQQKSKPTSQRKDVFLSAEPRFKSKLTPLANVGPGAYNPDTIESDWNRPTYNITIATEMEKRL